MLKQSIIALFLANTSANQDPFAEGSQSREDMRINGNMAAAFTPIAHNGVDVACHYDKLVPMAQRYQEWGIKNVMIGGTTGESVSLTFDERFDCVNEWLKISEQYKLDIYVHVGMNSV